MLHKFHEDQRYRINGNQTNETNQLLEEYSDIVELPSFSSCFDDD
jgi:hypothetical protein